MTDSAKAMPTASQGPALAGERIIAIDVLRGVAILGILIMNIQSFGMIAAAYINPTAEGDLSGANYLVWLLGHLLADQKFMTIFSMLFGAGVVLMTERQVQAGGSPARFHYRRNAILILFGLLHAYLIWEGDILVSYGLTAMVVYFGRRLAPRWLILIGILALCVPTLVYLAMGLTLPFWPKESVAEVMQMWRPDPEKVAAELASYRGSWLAQMKFRVHESLILETIAFVLWTFWRVSGLMLLGMAFFKMGILSAARSRRFYWWMACLGLSVGLPLTLLGVIRNQAHGWDLGCMFQGSIYNYWGSLGVSMGWIALVMLLCRSGRWPALQLRLAAVGQMALTNYLLQSLLCTTLFYGHGFGLFGKLSRVEQLGIVGVIWALQLLLSPLWLKYFTFGPAEWVWRCATYWKILPFLKTSR